MRRWWRWWEPRDDRPLDRTGPATLSVNGHGVYGGASAIYRWADQPTEPQPDIGWAGNLTPTQEHRANGGKWSE